MKHFVIQFIFRNTQKHKNYSEIHIYMVNLIMESNKVITLTVKIFTTFGGRWVCVYSDQGVT